MPTSKEVERGRKKRVKFLAAIKSKREPGIEIKPKRARVIGVFSCKGGVGKTTTVANLSMCLNHHMKNEVLAVDANLSAPNLGLHLGELNPKATIHDVLAGEIPIEKAIMKCHGLPVLLGSIAFGEEVHLVDLRGHLEPLKPKYRVIILDSAPGLGPEVISAMKSCDEIIIVTNPHVPTVASTLKTFGATERYKVPIMGTVVNMVRGEPFELSQQAIRKALGWPIAAVVPEDPKVREATAAGVPVVRYKPSSRAAQRFRKLGESLIKHIEAS
jgi:septum site-determining protein MinD